MGYANDRWMDDPSSYLEAKGELKGKPAKGGMIDPTETTVETTRTLVRFGGKEFEAIRPNGRQSSLHGGHGLFGSARYGSWWIAAKQYNKIVAYATLRKIPVNVAVRHLCFVPREWSDLGTRVIGHLANPLRAWTGVGNPVSGLDSKGAPRSYGARLDPDERIEQLFIPGLANGDLNHDVFQLMNAAFLTTAAD